MKNQNQWPEKIHHVIIDDMKGWCDLTTIVGYRVESSFIKPHNYYNYPKNTFFFDPKMIVYKDLLSGDEMVTDAFQLQPVMDKEGNEVKKRNERQKEV